MRIIFEFVFKKVVENVMLFNCIRTYQITIFTAEDLRVPRVLLNLFSRVRNQYHYKSFILVISKV